jgi:putative two-component system response regulator
MSSSPPRPAVDDALVLRRFQDAPQPEQELVARLAAHHPYSALHSQRVAFLAERLAVATGFTAPEAALLYDAALVHDAGKADIPLVILDSNRDLSSGEMALMRSHAERGARIVTAAGLPQHADTCLDHHERWDGGGYPRRRAGEAISLSGRITCVADVFEAMTAPERHYRVPLSPEAALTAIAQSGGTQFDPALVDPFLAVCADLAARPRLDPVTTSVDATEGNPVPGGTTRSIADGF